MVINCQRKTCRVLFSRLGQQKINNINETDIKVKLVFRKQDKRELVIGHKRDKDRER